MLARLTSYSIIVLFFCVYAAHSTPIDDFKTAVIALNRGDYPTALKIFRELAEQDIPGAKSALGAMYFEGKGVPRDYAAALRWHREAADKGHPASQFEVGAMYERGIGVRRDYVEAAKWFQRSAAQGYGRAQFNLGAMHFGGSGVAQDYVEAYRWFSLAAAGGGYLDTESNRPIKREAAKQRDVIARRLTPHQLTNAERVVRDWKPSAEPSAVASVLAIAKAVSKSPADLAAEFVLNTCYDPIDDVSRVRSLARLEKWQALADDVKNIMRPVDAMEYEAWLVEHEGQKFIVGVNQGHFKAQPTEVCQVSVNLPAEPFLSKIASKVKLGKMQRAVIGLQTTDIHELPNHPTGRTAWMIVARPMDDRPVVNISFMGMK